MTAGSTAVCDQQTAGGAGCRVLGACSVWGARLTCRLLPARKLLDDNAQFAQTCRDSATGIADACGPRSPGSHRVVWGLTARPPVPLRAFLRFPVCPPGSPPSPAVPGFPSSGVLRFGPFGRCPVPVLRRFPSRFPSLSNLHLSAAAGRFRRRRSRAAGTKVTSPAATTSPGSRDPPARQMGSGRARWDAAAESPGTSGRERRTSPRPNRPGRFTHVTQLVRQRRSVTGGRRHCAAPADGTGARSRSFPPAGLAGSRGLPRSPGPQVPADHLRDADVLLGRADQQDTLEFRVQAPDVSRRRSVVLPYRRCMPARNRAPPPAGRACRYARHARTWPGALATRRHNDHFGTQWKRTSDDGAADHNRRVGVRSLSLPISLSVMLSIGTTSRPTVAPVLEELS